MRRRWMGAMVLTLLGANGLFAQDTPPANAGPFQAKPEAKGKKAVPSRGGESDQDKPAFPLEEPAKGGNPMFTLAQFRKPKPPMAEPPAGEKAPATVPAKDELKNHAMMGLGFNTHHGIHMNVEVRRRCPSDLQHDPSQSLFPDSRPFPRIREKGHFHSDSTQSGPLAGPVPTHVPVHLQRRGPNRPEPNPVPGTGRGGKDWTLKCVGTIDETHPPRLNRGFFVLGARFRAPEVSAAFQDPPFRT